MQHGSSTLPKSIKQDKLQNLLLILKMRYLILVVSTSASSVKRLKQNKNNLVEIGNRKHGIQLKAVGSPDEKLDD